MVESIKKAGKINIPAYLLVDEDAAKQTIDFELIYNAFS